MGIAKELKTKKKENERERDGGGFSSKVKVVSGKVSPCFHK